MGERQSATIVLNGRTFDAAAEVLRNPAGSDIPLRPQSFAVLKYLTLNADRVVTKNELMAAVWPDVAVTENSLVQCIHEIRRALAARESITSWSLTSLNEKLIKISAKCEHAPKRDF